MENEILNLKEGEKEMKLTLSSDGISTLTCYNEGNVNRFHSTIKAIEANFETISEFIECSNFYMNY